MDRRDKLRADLRLDLNVTRRLDRNRKRRGRNEGGEVVPADPGPRPLPLEGGAEAPLD